MTEYLLKSDSFYAYRLDGKMTEIIINHPWQGGYTQEERESFCVRNQLIFPMNSCAVSCILAAYNEAIYE